MEKLTLPNVYHCSKLFHGELIYALPTTVNLELLHEFYETIQYNRKLDGDPSPYLLEVACYLKQFTGFNMDNYYFERGSYGWFMICNYKTLDKLVELDYVKGSDYMIRNN